MKRLALVPDAEPTLKTKMYNIKAIVRGLLRKLGRTIEQTKVLKRLAIQNGWVTREYADFRCKSTWLMVYNALAMERRLAALAVAA